MAEDKITLEQITKEGKEIYVELFQLGLSLAKKLRKDNDAGEKDSSRRAVLKGFLISGCQLSGQIIEAVSREHLVLALIGLRSLLEFDINSSYIFDHPKHRHDSEWIYDLCKDLFDRANDLGKFKNKLGGVGIKQRAKEIGRPDLYEKNYAGLCDYSHLILRPPFLNKTEIHKKLTPAIISHSLCHLADIIDAVIISNNFIWEHDLKNKVVSFRDKCEGMIEKNGN